MWRSSAGTACFITRGNISVAEGLTPNIFRSILITIIAEVITVSTRQLQPLTELAEDDLVPLAPAEEKRTLVAMPTDVDSRSFYAAFTAALEYSTGSAPKIWKTRVIPLN